MVDKLAQEEGDVAFDALQDVCILAIVILPNAAALVHHDQSGAVLNGLMILAAMRQRNGGRDHVNGMCHPRSQHGQSGRLIRVIRIENPEVKPASGQSINRLFFTR